VHIVHVCIFLPPHSTLCRLPPASQSTKQPERFARYRAVELKHGRIAMAACTGQCLLSQSRASACASSELSRITHGASLVVFPYVATLARCWHVASNLNARSPCLRTGYFVQSVLRWPGYLSTSAGVKFSDLPNGIAGFAKIPPLGLAQIFLFIGLMEAFTWPFYQGGLGKVPEGKLPGDVAGDLWVRYSDPEVKKHKLNVEINNGRAAMMGSLGMLMHDHILGTWIPPGF